jgi:hypothetical protein
VPLYGWKEMPAAGDSNPTRFIAKFQRNSPLPPFFPKFPASLPRPVLFDGLPQKLIRTLGFICTHVKARICSLRPAPPPLQPPLLQPKGVPQGHFHVPGELAAEVKLPHQQPAHPCGENQIHGVRIHGIVISIGSATAVGREGTHRASRGFDSFNSVFIQIDYGILRKTA